MLVNLLALTLALVPSLVSAGLFPPDSLVKKLEAKDFKKAMKENRTSVVAFVAPWCGHCQRMAPELSKAALGLYPLIPTYAVDCDDAKNRALCAEQGVQGFPTVKLFPRGKEMKPVLFDGPQRTASAFYYWAIRRIPHKNKKLYHVEDIEPWVTANEDKHRVLLLSKSKGIPLLWQVLANKYKDQLAFANHRDRKGKSSVKLGYEAGAKKDSKVLVYPAGSAKPVLFEGILKYDSLSKFFDSILDGTADLTAANEAAKEEDFALTPEEEEIERQQEAQRIALAHGGFTEMIDFEEAVKKYGTDFHESHGYGGMMGDMPKKKDKADSKDKDEVGKEGKKEKKEEDPIHRILKAQKEKAEKKAKEEGQMPQTGDGAHVVMEAQTDADAPHKATATAKTEPEPTPTAEAAAAEEPVPVEAPVAADEPATSEEPIAADENDAVEEDEEDAIPEEPIAESAEAPTEEIPLATETPKSGHVVDEL